MVLGAGEGGFVKQATENEQYAWWDKWDVSPTSTKRKRKREQEAAPQVGSRCFAVLSLLIALLKGVLKQCCTAFAHLCRTKLRSSISGCAQSRWVSKGNGALQSRSLAAQSA